MGEANRFKRYVLPCPLTVGVWVSLTCYHKGEIDGFVQLPATSSDLPAGDSTTQITRLNIHTVGTDSKFPISDPFPYHKLTGPSR